MKILRSSLKNLLFGLTILALVFAGCGKKEEYKPKETKTSKKVAVLTEEERPEKELMASVSDTIPLYEEEIEDFDDAITDFAVVENEDDTVDLKDVSTSTQETFKVADLSQDEEYLKELEEDWEDPELLALEEESAREEEYSFKPILFDINKHIVKNEDTNCLKENLETAKRAVQNGKGLTIIGHCCQLGEASFNMALSEKRAKDIKNRLVENGVSAEKIRIIGMGQENPLVWSDKSDKKELIDELKPNRRAELLVN